MCRSSPENRKRGVLVQENLRLYRRGEQDTFFVEENPGVLARARDVLGNVAQELNDVGQVVLVPRIVLARVRFKQVIARRQLERLDGSTSLHHRI